MGAQGNSWDDSAFSETIAEEAPTALSFDTIGEVFKGTYYGQQVATDEKTGRSWTQWLFRAAPGQDGIAEGELCALGGYAVDTALTRTPPVAGKRYRFEYVKDIDTNKGAPMKSIRVQVAG